MCPRGSKNDKFRFQSNTQIRDGKPGPNGTYLNPNNPLQIIRCRYVDSKGFDHVMTDTNVQGQKVRGRGQSGIKY